MLQNAYFLAKVGADTAENKQHFAEILPKIGNDPTTTGSASTASLMYASIVAGLAAASVKLSEILPRFCWAAVISLTLTPVVGRSEKFIESTPMFFLFFFSNLWLI